MRTKAVLIAGPTASGKSALAIELANKHNGFVINADSMQIYSVLHRLTARPTLEEMGGVEHLMFGHVHPSEPYSVAKWLDEIQAILSDPIYEGRMPVIVGGTGLYFKALLEGLSAIPPIDADIRRSLRDASLVDVAPLFKELKMLDPVGAAKLEAGDSQRIVRALEVIKSTGKSLSYWQNIRTEHPTLDREMCQKIVLSPPRSLLHERIALRFNKMIEEGALEEVKALISLNLDNEMPAMRAIGVSQLQDYLEGRCELAQAIELSVIATRQYAKRQSTWFRHQFDHRWIRIASANEL